MMKITAIVHDFEVTKVSTRAFYAGPKVWRSLRKALLITCAETCLHPLLTAEQFWNRKHVLQNPGNLVPAFGQEDSAVGATLELALADGVSDLVLCGHYPCGVMNRLFDPQCEGTPHLQKWLKHAGPTKTLVAEHYGHLAQEALREVVVQENVLVQLTHLLTYPAVIEGLEHGRLHLHAWVHDTRSQQVLAFEPDQRQFMPLLTLRPGRR